ncbi:MAG TPA: hypothetical protein VM452_07840 [Caulifigura sp.]|jgi:hypothetical protein|nr:hypothetical protein [Caulifigura sp.]
MKLITFDTTTRPIREVDFLSVLEPLSRCGDPVERAIWLKHIELLTLLSRHGELPKAVAMRLGTRVEFFVSAVDAPGSTASVRVELDWFDYSPAVNGLPRMHFRIKCYGKQHRPLHEIRRETPAEAAERLLSEFGLRGPI